MSPSRKIFQATLSVALLIVTLSCGSAHDADEYFVLVSANLQLPYWKAAGAGFTNAATQMNGAAQSPNCIPASGTPATTTTTPSATTTPTP